MGDFRLPSHGGNPRAQQTADLQRDLLSRVIALEAASAGAVDLPKFRAIKNGTQNTTATWADVAGWTQVVADAAFSFNTTTGIITINTDGWYWISFFLCGDGITGNNRVELDLELQVDTGGGYASIADTFTPNYAAHGALGAGGIGDALLRSCTSGDLFKLRVQHVANALAIQTGYARISALRVGGL